MRLEEGGRVADATAEGGKVRKGMEAMEGMEEMEKVKEVKEGGTDATVELGRILAKAWQKRPWLGDTRLVLACLDGKFQDHSHSRSHSYSPAMLSQSLRRVGRPSKDIFRKSRLSRAAASTQPWREGVKRDDPTTTSRQQVEGNRGQQPSARSLWELDICI